MMDKTAYTNTLARPAAGRGAARPRHLLPLLDAGGIFVSFAVTLWLLQFRGVSVPAHRISHEILVALVGIVLLILLFRDEQYSTGLRMSRLRDTTAVVKNITLAYLLATGLAFLTKGFFTGFTNYSRAVVLGSALVMMGLLLAYRIALHAYQSGLFARGEALRRVAVAGEGSAADEVLDFLERRPWLGIQCVGRLCPENRNDSADDEDHPAFPLVGSADEIDRLAEELCLDEVLVAVDPAHTDTLHRLMHTFTRQGIPYRIVPSLFEASYRSAKLAGLAELPVVDMNVDPLDQVERTFKRALDLTVAVSALAVMSPVLSGCALVIRLTSPGPTLFRQERVGRNGRHFELLKFRTMHEDAEERLAELEDQDEAEGHHFKIKDDPRITPVGGFLRKWSLDEFPQFVNVLKGDMSVVGPRPPLPDEVECYETHHHCRLKGTPGITGLWQVSGRSELTFEEAVKLDRYYLENWSLGMDLTIILKTFYVVLARKGAY